MGLSAKEMDEVGELVNQAFLNAFSNSRSVHHEKLLMFSFSLVKEQVPYFLFSGQLEGTQKLISLMYDDPEIRDFVLRITTFIFAKFGDTKNRWPQLVENLSEAVGFINPPAASRRNDKDNVDPITLTPEEIQHRAPTVEDVQEILLYNRWAVTMLLMHLYLMSPDDLNEIRSEFLSRKRIEDEHQAAVDAAAARRAAAAAQRNQQQQPA
jgi:hypothetical protein